MNSCYFYFCYEKFDIMERKYYDITPIQVLSLKIQIDISANTHELFYELFYRKKYLTKNLSAKRKQI